MKLINLKIGRQLIIGLSVLLSFVVALGVISYQQTNKIHLQTDLMYSHPLQVRMAIDEVKTDVYLIHWSLETALDQKNYDGMLPYLQTIYESEARMKRNFDILHEFYLGPKEDVEQLEMITLDCKINRDLVFNLIQAGNMEAVPEINIHKGSVIGGEHLNEILQKVEKISLFSSNKARTLRIESHELNARLTYQLIFIVVVFIAIALLINYLLLHNIRRPLIALTRATAAFRNGIMDARCDYKSKNELGVLSESFNALADSVQDNYEFNRNASHLADLMLSEDDARKFFQKTLMSIAEHTNSQMIAVYLLSDDKKRFNHFYSIGLNHEARQSFDIENLDGEFGKAFATGEIQHLTAIEKNSRFVFQAVSGDVIPGAIITIPIIASGDVLAMISMASLNGYRQQTLDFIQKMHNTLNARIAGILSFKRMIDFSHKLEEQNHELESQKTELYQQAAELASQNTELEVQKNQLNEANRLKTIFLSNMSHELRTPLNSVIALSGVLNRRLAGKIPEDEYSYIEVIERNGKNLLSLINDILDISRIEAGREEIDIKSFNVNSLVSEIVAMLSPQAEQKNIELIYKKPEEEISISSDILKCRHIIQNLIGNAVKFTELGSVGIEVRQLDETVEISVTDTGIGIKPEHIPHIFDEFRQADETTSRRFGGSGLGLAIARKYAQLLRGSISVKSKPNKGSEFIFVLPVSYSTENLILENEFKSYDAARDIKKDWDMVGDFPKTIMLIEDSEPAVVQIKFALEESGFDVMVAGNGFEALEILAGKIPDGIILDLMMPELDGFEVLIKLREMPQTAKIPVLILTAKHITKADLKVLKENNIFQLIQKGDVNLKDLLSSVKQMVFQQQEKPVKSEATVKEVKVIEGKPLVLVVEDNLDNMLTVKALLEDNYEILEAYNGKQAIEMTEKHHPHLVLMDISLPEMNGIDAFKEIRSNARLQNIPVIALTASAMINDREAIMVHGFDDYIAKPIDEKEFFKTIKETLYGA